MTQTHHHHPIVVCTLITFAHIWIINTYPQPSNPNRTRRQHGVVKTIKYTHIKPPTPRSCDSMWEFQIHVFSCVRVFLFVCFLFVFVYVPPRHVTHTSRAYTSPHAHASLFLRRWFVAVAAESLALPPFVVRYDLHEMRINTRLNSAYDPPPSPPYANILHMSYGVVRCANIVRAAAAATANGRSENRHEVEYRRSPVVRLRWSWGWRGGVDKRMQPPNITPHSDAVTRFVTRKQSRWTLTRPGHV